MLFAYHYSCEQLAEAVYDQKMTHLTLVRDLVDAEARNLGITLISFDVDSQFRKAVKSPTAESKMPIFRSIVTDVAAALLNRGWWIISLCTSLRASICWMTASRSPGG